MSVCLYVCLSVCLPVCLYLVFVCLFSCIVFVLSFCVFIFLYPGTALCISISQVIGCEDRLRNDLLCVGWGIKLYSLTLSVCLLVSVCFSVM